MENPLIKAARGRINCDVNLTNCSVLDLLGGRILEDAVVSIYDGYIVGVNTGLTAKKTINLSGRYLAPGLVDAHVHIESSMLSPSEYAKVVLAHGTTTVIADPHEIANVSGVDGINFMLDSSKNLPVNMYFVVPSCVPATNFDTAGANISAANMKPFLRNSRVVGLGEVMDYVGVLSQDAALMAKIALFKEAGLAIDGHAPRLSGKDLAAYALAGIGSDHECTTPAEALEKISQGFYIMLREGSSAKDVQNLLPAIARENASRFMLCSDDRHPNDLQDQGHIDYALRLLLDGGVHPIDAFRIACLNAALWFKIPATGAIAPGYKADLISFSSLTDFRAELVFSAGRLVADNGYLCEPIASTQLSLNNSVHIKPLSPQDLQIAAEADKKLRVIGIKPGSIITECLLQKAHVKDGLCLSDVEHDLLKICVVDRHKASGQLGLGFIKGLGLRRGAIACTVSHDSHNLVAAGADDHSILTAIEHLRTIKGGLVFALDDRIVLDLPLPIAGLMSDRDAPFVIERLREFDELFKVEGLTNFSPLMTLSFMALPVIPSLRITDKGLIDVDRFEQVSLFE